MSREIRVILGAELLLEPLTGIGQYTVQLGRGVLENDNISELKLFAHGKFIDQSWLNSQIISLLGKNLDIFSLFSAIRKKAAESSIVSLV
jgi:hypothetical protein